MNWFQWGKVCRVKEEGWLGIKNLKSFNLALVEKWNGGFS